MRTTLPARIARLCGLWLARFCLAGAIAISIQSWAVAATLRWASDGDVAAMDPYTRNETVQLSFLSNIYEPLVRRDRNLDLEPALATSWTRTSSTAWRFKLRPGVKWQDGTAFTADDVVFSAGRIRAKTSLLRSVFGRVSDVHAIDDLTVEIETDGPDPILPQELTIWLIMSRSWAEEHNATERVNLSSGQENYATRHTMGTGPFQLVSREPDRRTVVERNPNWWDRSDSNVDRAELNVLASATTRVAALLSGDMDMIYSVPPQDSDRIRNTEGFRLITGPELRTIFLGLDQWRDELLRSDVKGRNPLKDVRVREAFALAIDEPAIAARVMRGFAHPTWMMWGPGVAGYDAARDQRPKVDLARAKALLADAGYPDGFSLTLDCPNDRYVNDEAICTAVVAMLARIGVRVELIAQTKVKFFSKIQGPKYNTDFYLLGWTPPTLDALNSVYNLLVTRKPPAGEVNYAGYSNPEIDDLSHRIAVEPDTATRTALIHDLAGLVQKDFAYIPLHQQTILWAAKANIDLVQPPDNFFHLRFVRIR